MSPIVPLTPEQVGEWQEQIKSAQDVRARVQGWWDANIKAYAPAPTDDPDDYGTNLNTNRDFTLVERKKADLFFQVPDVQALPSPLIEAQQQDLLLWYHTTLLNTKLGLHGIQAKDMVHRVLFDVLCPAGTGFTVMGYEQASVPVPTVDPVTGQPTTVPVAVHEDLFWRHLSPRQILVPAAFRSTKWDDAPWLGFEFELPKAAAVAKGWVDETFDQTQDSDPNLYFDYGLSTGPSTVVRGQVIFYKSALYRPDRPHPLHQSQLVFLDGVDTPVEHKDSPYQTLDARGRLTPDSLIGFPIHPLTIRPMTDTAWVPSDCTLSRPIVNELNRFRGQMVEQRDANILRWMYNADTLPPDALNKIVRSPVGGMIGVPSDAFVGEGAIKELPHGTMPRENFTFNDYLDNDLARTHALDANQSGGDSTGDQTATEASIKQANVNARLGLERGVVLDWFITGVTKFSTLLQRFMPVQEAAAILGVPNAQQWDAWRKTVPSRLAFTALPDSALRHDLASERKRLMDEYAFLAKDPLINRAGLLKHMLPRLHLPVDVLNQQPPESKPEPPKLTLSISSTDLDPTQPVYGNVYQVLTQMGIKNLAQPTIDPVQAHAMQAAKDIAANLQTAHPGKMAQAESLSKHQAVDETGGMPGTGNLIAQDGAFA